MISQLNIMNKSDDANSNSNSNIERILIPSGLFSFGSHHDHVHHDDMNIHNETETETETKKVGPISSILEEALALLREFDENEIEMPVGSSASNSSSYSKNSSSSLFDIVSSTRKQ